MTDNTWNVQTAKTFFAKLTKIAEDMVDAQAQAPAPQDGAGSAGPQEVVDALAVIVDELEQVQAAIPAEPSNQGPAEQAPAEAPVAEPTEEPKLAQLQSELKIAKEQLDNINREKIAMKFAELHGDSNVQQAKFDEVMSSKDDLSVWTAKIESIEQYKQHEGASSTYRPAQQMSSWIKPRSKIAKLADNGLMSL